MARLSIYLLGLFRVVLDEQVLTGFRSNKNRALLAYLAAETGQARPRDHLMGLFWPDQPEGAARLNLRQTLFRLQHLLHSGNPNPPFLHVTREAAEFDPTSDYWLDEKAFTHLLEACAAHAHPARENCGPCMARLAQAVALYKGDFLSGFFLEGSAAFEEWLVLKREWLRREALEALEDLAQYHERWGDYEAAHRYAWRQVELDPLREEAHRQVMRALALSGRRSEALAQYEACRQLLADELGVAPADQTTALYERIRDEEFLAQPVTPSKRGASRTAPPGYEPAAAPIGLPATPQHNLPVPGTPFIGREAELARLCDRLLDPRYRLLTLVGPGGAGKTRLALAAAQAVLAGFTHGAWFVPLAGVSARPQVTDLLATTLGAALNFSFQSKAGAQAQLFDYLRAKELLLVLDNFEHFLAGERGSASSSFVAELLQNAPRVTVLVTSRERLNLQAEVMMRVAGLPVPADEPEGDIATVSSVSLFVERARRTLPEFTLTTETLTDVIRICRLVEGIPLGIELAATWVAHYTCAEIAQAIQHSLDFLAAPMPDLPERHRSVRAVFDYSWQLLTEHERAALAQMSVFQSGFGRDAALAVTSGRVPDLVSLVDKSWLQPQGPGRYSLHELVRQFAAEKLNEAEARAAGGESVQDRHRAYYLDFVARREAALQGEKPQMAMAEMKVEIDNLRRAWRWAVKQANVEALRRSARGLAIFYLLTGLHEEGERIFGEAVERLGPLAEATALAAGNVRAALSRLLVEQARFLFQRDNYDSSNAAAQEGISLAETCQEAGLVAEGHLVWGITLGGQGNFGAAEQRLEHALTLSQAAQWRRVETEAMLNLGSIYWQQSAYLKARAYYQQSLEICRQLGDRRGESIALDQLAVALVHLDQHAQAREHLQQVLPLVREVGDRMEEAKVLMHLANVNRGLGRLGEALTLHQQGLAIFRNIGGRRPEGFSLVNLGLVLNELGLYPEAVSHYEDGLRHFEAIGYRRGQAHALANLSLVLHNLKEDASACAHAQRALQIAQEIGERYCEGLSLTFWGHALAGLGQLADAWQSYQQALILWDKVGPPIMAMDPLAGLARLYLAQNDLSQAQAQAEVILPRLEDQTLAGLYEPLLVYLTCYRVLHANHDRRAKRVLRNALARLQERAARIEDEELRRSYLENVAAHRELLEGSGSLKP